MIREIDEELGIKITRNNLQFAHCLNFKNEKDEEILALVFKIIDWLGEPINKEPNKCKELTCFATSELPENIIPRHRHVIEMAGQTILYSESEW